MPKVYRRCNNIEQLDFDPELLESPVGRHFAVDGPMAMKTQTSAPPEEVDIAIVGGGIIGCGLAVQLRSSRNLGRRFILLDSQPHLVERYFKAMKATGQKVMRSAYEHQIAADNQIQMIDFARLHYSSLTERERFQIRLGMSGQRSVVPLDIFIAHVQHVAKVANLRRIAYRFQVASIQRGRGGYILRSSQGRVVAAKHIVLASGSHENPLGEPFQDVKDFLPGRVKTAYQAHEAPIKGRTAIVGSGLAAGHLILKVIGDGGRPVWILRGEDRYRCADFDTSYFRTEGMARFRREPVGNRAEILVRESRGSLMLEFLPLVQKLEGSGQLEVHRNSQVTSVEPAESGLALHLDTGKTVAVDHVIVSSGLMPQTSLLPDDVELLHRRYPLVDDDSLELKGYPSFFVAGPLASLALGPAAKNVDGARLASEKIVPALERLLTDNPEPKSGSIRNRILGDLPISVQRDPRG